MGVVAVTGGSGKLGRAVVRELVDHGWTVHNMDLVRPPEPIATFTRIDLTDFGQVVEAFMGIDQLHRGVDAVVHLGAIPGPVHAANAATFDNNMLSTYHVFSAARLARVRKVVWASSETIFGYPFDNAPERLPLDETCERRPNADYALEKLLAEALAEQFCRRDPKLSMVGLRFSNVLEVADYADIPAWQDDPMQRRMNLWSYIDTRDAAAAVRAGLTSPRTGHDIYAIFNQDTVMNAPTQDLVDRFYADVPRSRDFVGHESLASTEKALTELGWAPQHSWRTAHD